MITIQDIAARMVTQDNRCTSSPIFIVQRKVRIYGFDPDYADDAHVVWVDSDGEADAATALELDDAYQNAQEDPYGGTFTRTAYQDRWEFVTACFTEQGCKDYIAANGHNLKEPRIYVESGYRNAEWAAVREHLAAINTEASHGT